MASVALSSIQMDHGIQCRAALDMETVVEYVERLNAGDCAPAIDVFGDSGCCWIGDGWHRVMAAQQIKAVSIEAEIHAGGRQDALKHALHANTQHGLRRTNADKRRCVEIAVTEFSTLSNRVVAEMCGVSHGFVDNIKPQLATKATCSKNEQTDKSTASTKTGADGKEYPTKRKPKATESTDPGSPAMNRYTPIEVKVAAIKELVASGHNIEQISDALGLSVPNVRALILKYDLMPVRRKGRSAAAINAPHVIRETVNAVAATSHGLRLIHKMPIDLSKAEAKELLSELRDAMKSLGWLVTILKEKAND